MKNINEKTEKPRVRNSYLKLRETKTSQWNGYRRYSL